MFTGVGRLDVPGFASYGALRALSILRFLLPVDLIIMDKFDANRRKLLALGGVALGAAAILPTPAFATLSTPRPRVLTLNNLHTGESLKAEFFDGRGYIQDELA